MNVKIKIWNCIIQKTIFETPTSENILKKYTTNSTIQQKIKINFSHWQSINDQSAIMKIVNCIHNLPPIQSDRLTALTLSFKWKAEFDSDCAFPSELWSQIKPE